MRFVVLAWALSRLLIVAVMLSNGHADAFANWDGAWYGSIVAHGYEYAPDGRRHNVAFFPLFALLAAPFVTRGLPWPVVAAVLANAAFLAALVLVYRLAVRRYDAVAAKWCVAVACLLPPSLFCSVAYPQSVFLLSSALALDFWDRSHVVAAGGAGGFASAANPLGFPLALAMLLDGMMQRRAASIVAGLIAFSGIAAFSLYCALHFGDALAFVHAQRSWQRGFGIDLHAWRAIFTSLLTLDGARQNIMVVALVPLGALVVAAQARRLGRMMTLYALVALAMLVCSGTPFSVDRNAYAVAPVLLGYGATLRRVPAAGYIALALCALLLVIDAGRFARFEWVA
ncbi:MAG: DUF2029 domain-containing protein [Candidatus Eremiobacteraeota bacterium]|nr:DUF2029 domain-containing protein [Candidatus Eremiobacteraeota bacterium]